jgi:hypothetical protein
MKRSTIAAILSLLLPGAGLWYCGKAQAGLLNLAIAAGVPLLGLYAGFLTEHILWLFLAIAAGSSGYAKFVARRE